MGFSWLALLYIVVNALAYSVLDLMRKLLVRGLRPVPLLFFLSAGQVPFFWLWWAADPGAVATAYWMPALASVILNIAANLLFLEAVKVSPLSLTIPFLAFTPVFTTLVAVPMLGEVPTGLQFGGILLVVAGAFRLNLPRGVAASPSSLWRAFHGERGSVLMTAVALLWSLATPLDKMAMVQAGVPFHALVLNAGVGLGVLAVLLAQGRLRELAVARLAWGPLAVAVAASVLGLGFLLLAIAATWVGLVETLKRAIGSVLALLLGYRVFGEELTANKLVGIALMTAGVAAVVI